MNDQPAAKTVELDLNSTEYVQILKGPPESVTMRSGFVVLQPGQTVGRHSTGIYEEMVVVLEGEGEILFGNGPVKRLNPHTVAYCPPQTEHDVRNSGHAVMRYIYIVARAG